MIIRPDVVSGRSFYTCKCGWLDTAHLSNTSDESPYIGAVNLWNQLINETNKVSKLSHGVDGFKVTFRQDVRKRLRGIPVVSLGSTGEYLVKSGLSKQVKEQVALAIFQEVSHGFENFQGYWSNSGYSIDDLISNLIGFYEAVRPEGHDYVTRLCRRVSRETSLKVYDDNENFLSKAPTSREFYKPVLFSCDGCDYEKPIAPNTPRVGDLPLEFKSITPIKKSNFLDHPNSYFRDWNSYDESRQRSRLLER